VDHDRTGEPERSGQNEAGEKQTYPPVLRLLSSARFFVLFAVLGLFLTAATLLIYGSLLAVKTVWDTVNHRHLDLGGLQHLQVLFVELTDAFLLGCVLIIVSFGLYQLFFDADLPLPAWLRVSTLDELKTKLLGIVVVLLGVSFVGIVVEWETGSMLDLGVAVAAVIIAVSIYIYATHGRNGTSRH
jgi:uncharacterized membrane protein YqhA